MLVGMEDRQPDETLVVGADEVTFRVTSRESEGALLAFDLRMAPGGGPPALHRHDPFEVYRVDRGELAFYIADEDGVVRRRVVGAGGTVAIPSMREHTIRNESCEEAQAFVVFTPGAGMESFARAAAAEHDLDRLLMIAAVHGIEITRPLGAAAGSANGGR
jgi:oxalate decarboxylase/phosphoglucose isomerase-like protein (cupin superfamily)